MSGINSLSRQKKKKKVACIGINTNIAAVN